MSSTITIESDATLASLKKQSKWGYREAVWTASLLLIGGLLLEAIGIQFTYNNLFFPKNVAVGFSFTALCTLTFLFFRNKLFIIWLSGVHLTIVTLFLIGAIVMIMGVLPQTPEMHETFVSKLGFNRVTSSWPFILTMLLFAVNLLMGTLKKLIPFHWKDFGFFLNHMGLYVAVLAGFLGASDLQRLTMNLYEGSTNWVATNSKGQQVELPVAIALKDFKIDQYQPKLGLANNSTGKLFPEKKPYLVLIEEVGVTGEIADWKFTVTDYKSDAMLVGENFQDYYEEGSAPAALVKVENTKTGKIIEQWVSSGSFMSVPAAITLDDNYSLVMTAPEPKKFTSEVTVYTKEGDQEEATLEVNKPMSLAGWDIYQLSYDEKFGKWSKTSVVELVRDPWIKVVYVGIFMMLAGAFYTFWKGRNLITKK